LFLIKFIILPRNNKRMTHTKVFTIKLIPNNNIELTKCIKKEKNNIAGKKIPIAIGSKTCSKKRMG